MTCKYLYEEIYCYLIYTSQYFAYVRNTFLKKIYMANINDNFYIQYYSYAYIYIYIENTQLPFKDLKL